MHLSFVARVCDCRILHIGVDTGRSLVPRVAHLGEDKESHLLCVTPGEQRVANRISADSCNVPDWNSESLLTVWSAYEAGLVFSFTDVISFQEGLKYVNIFKI